MTFWRLHRNVKIRLGISFVQRFFNLMIAPFMAIYLATHFDAALAGLLILAVVSTGVIANLYGGHLADFYGRRPMLLLGELGSAATFGMMALADSTWWGSVLAVYVFFFLNNTLTTIALPAHDGMIVDVTASDDRKLAYTVGYWSFNVALAGSSLVAGLLYEQHFVAILASAAVSMLALALVTYFFIPETAPPITDSFSAANAFSLRSIVGGYAAVLRDSTFLRLLAAATLGISIDLQLPNYISVRLATAFRTQTLFSLGGWHPSVDGIQMFSMLRAENTLLVVGLALVLTPLLRRVPDAGQINVGILLYTLGFMLLALSNHGAILLMAMVVVTTGEIMNVPVKQALLANLVPADARTRYLAAYSMNVRLGQMVAAACITLGSVVPTYWMASLYAMFGLLAALFYRTLFENGSQRRRLAVAEVSK